MRSFFILLLIMFTAATASAEHLWVNNITVNEYNMTWNYTETFTGMDSITYKIGIDTTLGNNDSFVNAWEVLNADKDIRRVLRESIDSEPDVRINNETSGIKVIDIDSKLSNEILGKTHTPATIVNRYTVKYSFNDSILNASSIWFLGQANTSATIVMPAGIDVVNISGMNNVTENITDHTEVSGIFKQISKDRGEITLNLTKNTSFQTPVTTSPAPAVNITANNTTKTASEIVSVMRDATVIIAGIVIILLIYVFKIYRK